MIRDESRVTHTHSTDDTYARLLEATGFVYSGACDRCSDKDFSIQDSTHIITTNTVMRGRVYSDAVAAAAATFHHRARERAVFLPEQQHIRCNRRVACSSSAGVRSEDGMEQKVLVPPPLARAPQCTLSVTKPEHDRSGHMISSGL
jgi:hypothetical protein